MVWFVVSPAGTVAYAVPSAKFGAGLTSSLVPFDHAVMAVTYVVPGSTVCTVPAGTTIGPLQPSPPAEIVADAVVVQGRSSPPVAESRTLMPGSSLVMLKVYVPVNND